MTTPTNFADLVARTKERQAALGAIHELRDPVADARFWEAYIKLQKVITTLQNADDLTEPTTFLELWEARLTIMQTASKEITRQLAEAPDYRPISDQKLRDQAWQRLENLRASQRALVSGVEWLGGAPCVPEPLRSLLGFTTTPDGRRVIGWYGTTSEVEANVVEWRERHRVVKSRIEAAVTAAEALLAVGVSG